MREQALQGAERRKLDQSRPGAGAVAKTASGIALSFRAGQVDASDGVELELYGCALQPVRVECGPQCPGVGGGSRPIAGTVIPLSVVATFTTYQPTWPGQLFATVFPSAFVSCCDVDCAESTVSRAASAITNAATIATASADARADSAWRG